MAPHTSARAPGFTTPTMDSPAVPSTQDEQQKSSRMFGSSSETDDKPPSGVCAAHRQQRCRAVRHGIRSCYGTAKPRLCPLPTGCCLWQQPQKSSRTFGSFSQTDDNPPSGVCAAHRQQRCRAVRHGPTEPGRLRRAWNAPADTRCRPGWREFAACCLKNPWLWTFLPKCRAPVQ